MKIIWITTFLTSGIQLLKTSLKLLEQKQKIQYKKYNIIGWIDK
jgi:hypothetical protein